MDRVLNDRPNVSEKARVRVSRAIEETGFVRNQAAASLARNRAFRFHFLLPAHGDEYLGEVLRQVHDAKEAVRREMTLVEAVQVPMHNPHEVAAYLSRLTPDEVDGVVVMAPEAPQVRDAIARLNERRVRTIRFLAGRERIEGEEFVGADDFAAGASAARIMGGFTATRAGSVMVVAESIRAPDTIQRRLGFDAVMHERFAHLNVLPTLEMRGQEERTRAVIDAAFAHHDDIVAVYVASSEARLPVMALESHRRARALVTLAHERTQFTEAALRSGALDAVIAQDPGHAVRSAIRILRARLQDTEPYAAQERIRNEILIRENL